MKKFKKKLTLNKRTISSNLSKDEQKNLKGGSLLMSNCYPECESWQCPTQQMPSCKVTLCGTSCYEPCGTLDPAGTCTCM